MKDNITELTLAPPNYDTYSSKMFGVLAPDDSCYALWHYFITAQNTLNAQRSQIVYEGDLDPEYNYRQLFTSIAMLYGVAPETMPQYWILVDKQAEALGLTPLPFEERYRFSGVIEIRI